MYVQDLQPGSEPVALTAVDSKQRFADYILDEPRNRLVAVCEDHSAGEDQEARNSIAAIGEQAVGTNSSAAGSSKQDCVATSTAFSPVRWLCIFVH